MAAPTMNPYDEVFDEEEFDDESYIEEEISEDYDEEIEEEETIEEEEEEDTIEDEEEETFTSSRQTVEESDTDGVSYTDDSTEALSISSDAAFYEGMPVTSHHTKDSDALLEMQNAAVSQGARAAMQEDVQREKSILRQKARDALSRQRLQQQYDFTRRKRTNNKPERKGTQEESAHRRLLDEIQKFEKALSKKREGIAKEEPTRQRERKKKALAELRRQAAREELARNNFKLKVEKASKIASRLRKNISPNREELKSTKNEIVRGLEDTQIPDDSRPQRSIDPKTPWAVKLQQTQMLTDKTMTTMLGLQHPSLETGKGTRNHVNAAMYTQVFRHRPIEGQSELSVMGKVSLSIRSSLSEGDEAPVEEEKSLDNKGTYLSPMKNPVYEGAVDPLSIPSLFRASYSKSPRITGRRKSYPQIKSPHLFKRKVVDPALLPSLFRSSLQQPNRGLTSKETSLYTTTSTDTIREYYSLTDLQEKKVIGIDYSRREQYLSPEDFLVNFKMSKEDFAKLPQWKRERARQLAKLF